MKNVAGRSTDGKRRALATLVGITITVLAGAASAGPILVSPADGCGQTLSVPGTYLLTGDLMCSGAVSGIIIDGNGIVLDLGGHTISNATCDPDVGFAGINARAPFSPSFGGVHITNGTVVGFNDGIILSGMVSSVEEVTVTGACRLGIVVMGGPGNHLHKNVVTANGIDGILLCGASWADVNENESSGNGRAGVALSCGTTTSMIIKNVLSDNGTSEGYGVVVVNGTGNTIGQNVVTNNVNGIVVAPPSNFVKENQVSGSANIGIAIEDGASPADVKLNTVLGSGVADMSDGAAACGMNSWLGNTFETDLVAGVSDGGPGVGCI